MKDNNWISKKDLVHIREALRHAKNVMEDSTEMLFTEWPDNEMYNVFAAMNSLCVRITRLLEGGDQQ